MSHAYSSTRISTDWKAAAGGMAAAAGVVASTVSVAEPASTPPQPLSVLVIMAEDMGLQLGAYGDDTVPTPNIDRLAEQGVTFQNAYATAPTCSPARSSFYTGLYPHQNGHYGLASEYGYRVHDNVPTLPERLGRADIASGVTYKIHVDPQSKFKFDYEFTHEWFIERGSHPWNIPEAVDAFAGMMDEIPKDQPFFFQANTHDTHKPWVGGEGEAFRPQINELGEPYVELTAEDEVMLPAMPDDVVPTEALHREYAEYYNAVQRFDWTVGKYLDALEASGRADRTVIILTADHGPPLARGKLATYELGLRVPLIIRWPGVTKPGDTRDQLVSHVDLTPTMDDALGLDTPEGTAGLSLLPLLKDPDAEWRDYVVGEFFSHTTYRQLNPGYTIRDDRYKLLINTLSTAKYTKANTTNHKLIPAGNIDYWAAIKSPQDTLAHRVYRRLTDRPAVELYDLQEDPYEYDDLAEDPEYADVRARLEAGLQTFREATDDPFVDEAELDRFIQHYIEKQSAIVAWEEETGGNLWENDIRRGDQSTFERTWRPERSNPPLKLFSSP